MMKLNLDCIRDILIEIENSTSIANMYQYDENDFAQYTEEVALYHLRQCNMMGYFYEHTNDVIGGVSVGDLTPAGHEFLANIRSNTIWSKTKEVAKKIGVSSIYALKDIAVAVVSEVVKNAINS